MTALMSGFINDLDKAIKTKSSQSPLVSDCNGQSNWIFISPTRQNLPGRLFT